MAVRWLSAAVGVGVNPQLSRDIAERPAQSDCDVRSHLGLAWLGLAWLGMALGSVDVGSPSGRLRQRRLTFVGSRRRSSNLRGGRDDAVLIFVGLASTWLARCFFQGFCPLCLASW